MDLKQLLRRADAIAAGGAVVMFVIFAFGLGTPFLAAIALAIVAYIGISLARSRLTESTAETADETAERAELAFETSLAKVSAIRDLAARIPKDGTRELVLRICDQSDRILATLRTTGAVTATSLFLEQLLEPTEALLETYVRFSSRGIAAAEILARNESQDLPAIERSARLFAEQIERGVTDSAALATSLEFTPETVRLVTPREANHSKR
jgi:hypothetical protein